jgi:hypothetical protein
MVGISMLPSEGLEWGEILMRVVEGGGRISYMECKVRIWIPTEHLP